MVASFPHVYAIFYIQNKSYKKKFKIDLLSLKPLFSCQSVHKYQRMVFDNMYEPDSSLCITIISVPFKYDNLGVSMIVRIVLGGRGCHCQSALSVARARESGVTHSGTRHTMTNDSCGSDRINAPSSPF